MDSLEAIVLIENTSQTVLFGADPKGAYRRLAQLCHPDKAPEKLKTRAERAFAKLNSLYKGLVSPPAAIQIGDWKIKGPIAKGDICDVYLTNPEAVLKIARGTNDNDLMEVEGEALKYMDTSRSFVGHKNYIPRLIETFKASGRRVNITTLAKGCYSLVDIMVLYPDGLDFRHCVWMMNRALSAIGFAHQNGLCHGAILPQHLLYEPHSHGLQLVDWCYSIEIGQPLVARVKSHSDSYPLEVARKEPVSAALDIYMLAKAIQGVACNIPKRFRWLFEHCQAESPRSRPEDAWELQDRWRSLAKEEFGEPKYLELVIPIT